MLYSQNDKLLVSMLKKISLILEKGSNNNEQNRVFTAYWNSVHYVRHYVWCDTVDFQDSIVQQIEIKIREDKVCVSYNVLCHRAFR